MKKKQIRKTYLQKRSHLTETQFNELENLVIKNCLALIKKSNPKVVHCFISILDKHELNTEPIFKYCWENNIKTVVPITNFSTSTLKTSIRDTKTKLHVINHGIPEPEYPLYVENTNIDLVITPLISFDKNGHRVGFGKGFYDRFFANCTINTKKAGLSLFDPVDKIDDINELDYPLDYAITPSKLFIF